MDIGILIVNRDESLRKGLVHSLKQDGYHVDSASTLEGCKDRLEEGDYELIILDILLPDGYGLSTCEIIREYSQSPMIILTEKDEVISKILAFEYGADDYITIPFNILELKARIRAILRRTYTKVTQAGDQAITIDDFTINPLGRGVILNGERIDLTGREFDLFYLLITNPEKVFTREELLESLWGYEYFGDLRTVDVHVRRLREKIGDEPKKSRYIHTKWGVGYYFKGNEDEELDVITN
ncbi:MAG: response regulator transcription factor [Tissierellia bacterium]|nr:response regulator transcription factor [Tissierellia bacterium]